MKWLDRIKNSNFNFAHNGLKFAIAPAIILLVGIIMLCIPNLGFNLGLDFTGGSIISIDATNVEKSAIESKMDTYKIKYTITEEESSNGKSYSIKFNSDDNNTIITEMQAEFPDDFKYGENIEAATSNEKIMSVFWSILAACAGLMIYMLFRFKITAGIATLLALCHDVLMICSLMIIFQIEINTSFIAAILTVIAYSINNSLVVFDRVRDLEKHNTDNLTLEEMLNKSIYRTLGRCVLTVTTTLATLITLTVVSIVMNLPTLIQFSLPIIMGLIAGTYSSLFLIAPMYRQFEMARILGKQRKQQKKTNIH